MHCLPWAVLLCRPVPAHPECSTYTHRHIISTEVTFWSSSCNSTVTSKSDGPPIRFKLLDSNHILQQTTHSLNGFHFSETPQIIRYQLLTEHRCNSRFIKFVCRQCLQFITTNKKLQCPVATTCKSSFFAGVAYPQSNSLYLADILYRKWMQLHLLACEFQLDVMEYLWKGYSLRCSWNWYLGITS
jgi:hypothetical protein